MAGTQVQLRPATAPLAQCTCGCQRCVRRVPVTSWSGCVDVARYREAAGRTSLTIDNEKSTHVNVTTPYPLDGMPDVVDEVHLKGNARVSAPDDAHIVAQYLTTTASTWITGDHVKLDTWRADLAGRVMGGSAVTWTDSSHRSATEQRSGHFHAQCTANGREPGELSQWSMTTSTVTSSTTQLNTRASLLDWDTRTGLYLASNAQANVEVDFGKVVAVSSLVIGTYNNAHLYNFYLKVSNSTEGPWTDVKYVTSSHLNYDYATHQVPLDEAAVGRYFRLQRNGVLYISELRFFCGVGVQELRNRMECTGETCTVEYVACARTCACCVSLAHCVWGIVCVHLDRVNHKAETSTTRVSSYLVAPTVKFDVRELEFNPAGYINVNHRGHHDLMLSSAPSSQCSGTFDVSGPGGAYGGDGGPVTYRSSNCVEYVPPTVFCRVAATVRWRLTAPLAQRASTQSSLLSASSRQCQAPVRVRCRRWHVVEGVGALCRWRTRRWPRAHQGPEVGRHVVEHCGVRGRAIPHHQRVPDGWRRLRWFHPH